MQTKPSSSFQYLPQNAFLFFPKDDQIKVGNDELQWRKIFEGGMLYSEFEESKLRELEQRIYQQKAIAGSFFNKANKLRYLQANKFKISKTYDSIMESTKWRAENIPIKQTPQLKKVLTSGAFYFGGRDYSYRPIIVADIGKIDPDTDIDFIPNALVTLLQFMIQELLIEGQVENYIMILDLSNSSFSLRGAISNVLSFTSNSYRGRLFASYVVGMPGFLNIIWNGLVSKFISENTLQKIKTTTEMTNPLIWTHISRNVVQTRYGGNLAPQTKFKWPPSNQLLLYEEKQNLKFLISKEEYQKKNSLNLLVDRKICWDLLPQSVLVIPKKLQSKVMKKKNRAQNQYEINTNNFFSKATSSNYYQASGKNMLQYFQQKRPKINEAFTIINTQTIKTIFYKTNINQRQQKNYNDKI